MLPASIQGPSEMLCALHRYDAKKGDKSQLAKALTEDHSPEMQQWLLAEMKQNRSKKIAKTKASSPLPVTVH